ncbi:hypothetical protein DSO57_1018052 [Entomophthora muscae]|uniref:Uncharacterized protein n=1 Tax=Entomophthora muscae TaxID=34485 RepID=A0ACC2UPI1_9FUNG|nr:hypothetical protein DSO57_1018052 [Entomophthora muscae]
MPTQCAGCQFPDASKPEAQGWFPDKCDPKASSFQMCLQLTPHRTFTGKSAIDPGMCSPGVATIAMGDPKVDGAGLVDTGPYIACTIDFIRGSSRKRRVAASLPDATISASIQDFWRR